MNFHPIGSIRRVRDLPAHLHDLAEHLQRLSARVRESVAEAVGDTLSHTVKDLLRRALAGQPVLESRPPFVDDDDWNYESADSAWLTASSPWDEPRSHRPPPTTSSTSEPAPVNELLAVALQAAGWWLYRRGTWMGALGVGLAVGSVAIAGGRLAWVGLNVVERVHEILALQQALAGSAQRLNNV